MSRLEKFGLLTGIIGLISDTIALITFFAGHWGSPTTTEIAIPATAQVAGTVFTITTYEIPLVIRTVLIFILIYSWAAISWVIIRRSFRLRKYRAAEIITDITFRTVSGIGILILPVFVMWTITLWQAGVPTRAEGDKIYAEFKAKHVASSTDSCRDVINYRDTTGVGANCVWDQSDASFWAVPVSFIFQVIFIGILYVVFWLLIPVIYPDMSVEEIAYELGINQPLTLLESNNEAEVLAKVLPMRNVIKPK